MTFKQKGLGISQPVSLWNKPLKIEPKSFFLNLAKAAVNGSKLEFDDAFENLMDAVDASTLENKAEQVAWVLIYRALMRSIKELVENSLDLIYSETETKNNRKLDTIGQILSDQLLQCNVRIDTEFFKHPERFDLLNDIQPGLTSWLNNIGLPQSHASALANRLPHSFALALHEEWIKDPEQYSIIRDAIHSPFTRANDRARQWLVYAAWLRAQINTRMFAESFGLQQVYVPLNAYILSQTRPCDIRHHTNSQEDDAQPERRLVVELHKNLAEWIDSFDRADTVRVVSGGPGSGKSSFAKMFASEIADSKGIPVVYVPLHLINPNVDLIRSIADFATQSLHLPTSPLDVKNGDNRLLIIFDGLDELSMQGKANADVAHEFMEEVLRKSESFSNQNMQRQFIITGRDLSVQAQSSRLRHPKQIIYVLPYYYEVSNGVEFEDPNRLLETDLRDNWWYRYGKASGKNFLAMPDELRIPNLSEITSQPLLNYLVALSLNREQLNFTSETSLNEIYRDLLEAVFERQWEGGRRHSGTGDLDIKAFSRILEEIALAVWHGDGRVATVADIQRQCRNNDLHRYLERFQECAKDGVTSLLTAFYFRQAGDIVGEKTFEFTHKSFGEYLTGLRVVRGLERVQIQLARREDDPDDGWDEREALFHWTEICGQTALDKYVQKFIRDEVSLRPPDVAVAWLRTICRLIRFTTISGIPMERFSNLQYREMTRQSRNAEEALVAAHSACASKVKQVFDINWTSSFTLGNWLRKLQGSRTDGANILSFDSLNYFDLSNCVLDVFDFYNANLRHAKMNSSSFHSSNFSFADLRDANLENSQFISANFYKAYLNNANLTNSVLKNTNFSHSSMDSAILVDAYLFEANLLNAKLRLCDLHGANLENANLKGASLEGANLEGANLKGANLEGAFLKNANLKGARLEGANLRSVNLNDIRGALYEESSVNPH